MRRMGHVCFDPFRHDVRAVSPQDDALAKADVVPYPLPVQGGLAADMQTRYPLAQVREDPVERWPVAGQQIGAL